MADQSGGAWRQLSAVTSGVADVRALVAEARARREAGGRTVVFIDELHRFNKAQQDALLPHVEDGAIILLGATTENPYYELNSPLLSRMRVYRLEPLEADDLAAIIARAVTDPAGLAGRVTARPGGAGGAARAVRRRRAPGAEHARGGGRDRGRRVGARWADDVTTAAQERLLAYDRTGDGHYEAISAFIKSHARQRPRCGAVLVRLA